MTHLGLLLACDHYPHVPVTKPRIDPNLHALVSEQGSRAQHVSVFACHDGVLPTDQDTCDIWLVSGALLVWNDAGGVVEQTLKSRIRKIVANNQPLFGLFHGEHVIHDSLVGSTAPNTPKWPRCVRNPIMNHQSSDRLFVWDERAGRVRECGRSPAGSRLGRFASAKVDGAQHHASISA